MRTQSVGDWVGSPRVSVQLLATDQNWKVECDFSEMEGCHYNGSRPVVRARICSQLAQSFQAFIAQQLHGPTRRRIKMLSLDDQLKSNE